MPKLCDADSFTIAGHSGTKKLFIVSYVVCTYFAPSMPTLHCNWHDKIAMHDQYTCVVQGYVRIGFRVV